MSRTMDPAEGEKNPDCGDGVAVDVGEDGFPSRLQQVLGKRSIRSFAGEAGISPTTLRQYLSGRSEPTRLVLIAMARVGHVSLEWLVDGTGEMTGDAMRKARAQDQAELEGWKARVRDLDEEARVLRGDVVRFQETLEDYRRVREVELFRDLDLSELALVASRGTQENAWQLLKLLGTTFPRMYSVDEFVEELRARGVHVTSMNVLGDLAVLKRKGIIRELEQDGVSRYGVSSSITNFAAQDVADISQTGKEACKAIIKQIIPVIEYQTKLRLEEVAGRGDLLGKKMTRGTLQTTYVTVPAGNGRRLLEDLKAEVRRIISVAGEGEGVEGVTVVFGAAVTREVESASE